MDPERKKRPPPTLFSKIRLRREKKTVQAMIDLYCRHHHKSPHPCSECQELLSYAYGRLDRCPLQTSKPTCDKCTIHCFKPEKKEQIISVMRYAGPRMLLRHPLLAIFHLWDRRS